MVSNDELNYLKVDEVTAQWRQSDFYLGEFDFIFMVNSECHVASSDELEEDDLIYAQETHGFSIVTQTCDIVRNCRMRPYLEVCPLVKVSEEEVVEVEKQRLINYVFIPNLAQEMLVGDIERIMTIEKSCLLNLEKGVGCSNDFERRRFSQALSRKRARFAFPDEFNGIVNRLLKRLKEKHNKISPEGEALRTLREIRVLAHPSWEESEGIHFYFVKQDERIHFDETAHLTKWLSLIGCTENYSNVTGAIVSLEEMSAREYIDSDMLDLENLSRT